MKCLRTLSCTALLLLSLWLLFGCTHAQRFPATNANINAYVCWYYPDWYVESKVPGLECDDWR